jgi:hypothetical protein
MKAGALSWLLEESNPSIRYLTLTDVMGESPDGKHVRAQRGKILRYGPVETLKKAQRGKGYWPPSKTCYEPKFTSTVWQLMLLGELGAPRSPWIESALEHFMAQHQMENGAFCCPRIGDLDQVEEEPCLTGNMLRTLLLFGYYDDSRVKKALAFMPEMQFEDGGWNCDHPGFQFEGGRLNWGRARHDPTHSSVMSTIEPLWAYSEIPRSKWTRKMKSSIERGAEFLLVHRLYKSHHDWSTIELRDMEKIFKGDLMTRFHFPMYYYYDVLHALRVLTKLGYQNDERLKDAVHLVLSKKTPEGRWLLDGDWVRERTDRSRKTLVNLEQLNEPSKWITLNCYRALVRLGELEIPTQESLVRGVGFEPTNP